MDRAPQGTGFTLLEVLLSLALIALLTGIVAPIYLSFATRNDLDIAATTVAQSVRRAATLASAIEGDSGWGVTIATSSVIIFEGTSYATRVLSEDETYPLSGIAGVSGTTEYDFAKFTGLPATPGTVTLTAADNEIRTISINAESIVDY